MPRHKKKWRKVTMFSEKYRDALAEIGELNDIVEQNKWSIIKSYSDDLKEMFDIESDAYIIAVNVQIGMFPKVFIMTFTEHSVVQLVCVASDGSSTRVDTDSKIYKSYVKASPIESINLEWLPSRVSTMFLEEC